MKKGIVLLIGFWVLLGIAVFGLMVAGFVRFTRRDDNFASAIETSSFEYSVSDEAPAARAETVEDTVITQTVNDGDMVILLDQTLAMDDIDDIELSLSAAEMTISHSEDGQFRIVQRGRGLPDELRISVERSGSSIAVLPPRDRDIIHMFDFGFPKEHYIDVYIPADYYGDLKVRLSAGSLDIEGGYSVDELEVHVSAGKLTCREQIVAVNADVTVSAGGLNLNYLFAEEYNLRASAGELIINELTGSGEVSASAGGIELKNVEITDSLNVRSSAGGIDIGLVGEPSLDFTGKASAGSLKAYFLPDGSVGDKTLEMQVGDGPYVELDVSSSAGSINITKA